ncbi:MAG: TIGR03032 family protein [Acidimicrobiia bacterium]
MSNSVITGPARIDRPIFLVSPPRSGSSLLFETLGRAPGVFSVGTESHALIDDIPSLNPSTKGWDSNRLTAEDATDGAVAFLKDRFVKRLRDRTGARPVGGPTRMLEKTPKNALRVPFLAAACPDASFVYLYRDPRETISSMLDAWRSGQFVTYPDLPGWSGVPWSLLLVPGWRELQGRRLGEIVARQWSTTVDVLLDDLEALPSDRWCIASYDRLVADPDLEIRRLCAVLQLEWDIEIAAPLAHARHTIDSPHPEKWHRNADEVVGNADVYAQAASRAREIFAAAPRIEPIPTASPSSTVAPDPAGPATARKVEDPGVFAARHSPSMHQFLEQLGATLAITTYQASKLLLIRCESDRLNSHYRNLAVPMGIAYNGRELAVGLRSEVVVFGNQPSLGDRLDPPGSHDACFVARRRLLTGDIRVHDLAWGEEGLWVVNTRFSCLATLDDIHSFVPRWRPGFITAMAPEDRCHLNGLAMVDGRPRFVTVLGMTDAPHGWREHKADGGAVIDVPSGAPVSTGLAMPHSPRWHDGRLWVLESGIGALVVVDPETGARDEVTRVPGFARGLAFAGRYALIGLSKVREHVFDGLPLTGEGREELQCGVRVIDTVTGEHVAHLTFDGAVQEIFDVAILFGTRFPELVEPGAPLADSAFLLPPPG